MSRIVRITESDLRAAVVDERYWRVGHPEHGAFQTWVGQGFRGLNPSDGGARTTVWVRAYMREGHQVSAHWRGAWPRQPAVERFPADAPLHPTQPDADVQLASWWARYFTRIPRAPDTGGRGSGRASGPTQRERRLGRDGRDAVQDVLDDSKWTGRLQDGVDQWERAGGEARRDADLQRLRPTGEVRVAPNGTRTYMLADGRYATIRTSTSPGYEGTPTLEIASPRGGPLRTTPTDKIRYPTH
jgi:hypothetical protein